MEPRTACSASRFCGGSRSIVVSSGRSMIQLRVQSCELGVAGISNPNSQQSLLFFDPQLQGRRHVGMQTDGQLKNAEALNGLLQEQGVLLERKPVARQGVHDLMRG